ncbi:MAG: NAD(P)-dependent oxidoreductase [Anaeroplasmataceae bacterium]
MNDIILEAKRCLKCKNALCQKGCPVATPIPEVFQLFLDGKIDEAGELLFNNNPLSAICSLICPHETNCFGSCVLNRKAVPIHFYEIEQYISSFYLDKSFKPDDIKMNNYNIGIIGAGPAGITLSILLARKGYNVTIIDSKDKIGGVLRYGIPDFRLPKVLLDKLLDRMTAMGIKFRPNTLIGPTITLDDMFSDGYDVIFIGTGVWKPNRLRIPGETLGNVHFAIDFLKNPSSYTDLGDNVVIIGAGNVAMDAARTVRRLNHASVKCIFFRGPEDITCNKAELDYAILDGVLVEYYLNTVQIESDGIIVEPVIKNISETGEVSFINDSKNKFKIPSTSVIIAVGQGPQTNIVASNSIETTDKGLLKTNQTGITSKPGVFAAGDVVNGPQTVVQAVQYTKIVAKEIEAYCNTLKK